MSATDSTVTNRSEIVFLYDAEDTNPNGNPLSANDRPRIDETTGKAVVTDVRLKRYLRDQLDDDDYGIYIRNPSKADYQGAIDRDDLFRRVTGLSDDEIEDMTGNEAADAFLSMATVNRGRSRPTTACSTRLFPSTVWSTRSAHGRLDSPLLTSSASTHSSGEV
jgi:hypothetical protein